MLFFFKKLKGFEEAVDVNPLKDANGDEPELSFYNIKTKCYINKNIPSTYISDKL